MSCEIYLPEKTWSTRYGREYFTVDIIGVHVHENSYAQFQVFVQNGKRNWTLLRRFSEFDTMRSRIQTVNTGALPPLPPKTFCCRDLNPEYLERRKSLLQGFLHDLLVLPKAAREPAVQEFLQLQSSQTFFV